MRHAWPLLGKLVILGLVALLLRAPQPPMSPADGPRPSARSAAVHRRRVPSQVRSICAWLGNLLIVVSLTGLVLLAFGPRDAPAREAPAKRPDRRPLPVAALSSPPEAADDEAFTPVLRPPSPEAEAPAWDLADNQLSEGVETWPDDPGSTAWLAEDGYRLSAREPGRFVAVGAPLARPVADVVVTATFRKVGGPPGGGYGLIVRDRGPGPRDGRNQAGRYYVFEVGDRGEVGAWRREGDRWADLVPWAPSAAVRPGGMANELEARAAGERLTFLVNGVEVVRGLDRVLGRGAVGIFVGGDFNEVLLERFTVGAPDGISPTPAPPPVAESDDVRGELEGEEWVASALPRTAIVQPRLEPITRVVIPSIRLDAPVVPAGLEDRGHGLTWAVPARAAGHAAGTPGPGQPGNAVLLGHVASRSLGDVFRDLDRVRPGDPVRLFGAREPVDYRVAEVRSVGRADVAAVQPTGVPSVSLITCRGVWLPLAWDYTERLVVRAELAPAP